jgi:hypothetical protein
MPYRTRASAFRPAAAALVPATTVDPRMRICHSDFVHRQTLGPRDDAHVLPLSIDRRNQQRPPAQRHHYNLQSTAL